MSFSHLNRRHLTFTYEWNMLANIILSFVVSFGRPNFMLIGKFFSSARTSRIGRPSCKTFPSAGIPLMAIRVCPTEINTRNVEMALMADFSSYFFQN